MPRALIVDDSRAMRMILARTLTAIGFDVSQASNGREGMEVLEEGPPVELVLVDWNMPEVTGFEFVQLVRARPAFSHVRLIMVTTETEIEQVTRALEAGADEYIMKPFTPDVIEEKLRLAGVI